MPTYKAAFLTDLGKVLIDYDWDILCQLLERHAGRPSADLKRRFLNPEQQEISRQFCTGQISNEQFYRECCQALGIRLHQLSYERFVLCFNRVFTGEISGAIQLLPSLKKRFDLMIMITNTNDLHFNFVKRKIPRVFKQFDMVVASHEVGFLKPDRKIWDPAIEFMKLRGIRPENALFVDDLQKNLDSAKDVGIGQTFLFYPGREQQFQEYLKNCWQIDC